MNSKDLKRLGVVVGTGVLLGAYIGMRRYSTHFHELVRCRERRVITDHGLKIYAVEYYFEKPLNVYVREEDVVLIRGEHMEIPHKITYGLKTIRVFFQPFDAREPYEIQSLYRWMNLKPHSERKFAIDELEVFDAHYHFADESTMDMGYRLFEPRVRSQERLPLVVYLHDYQGIGDDNISQLTSDRSIFAFASTYAQKERPCFILACQLPKNKTQWLDPKIMNTVVDIMIRCFEVYPKIDAGRIYVVGKGIGADGALAMMDAFPNALSAGLLDGGQLEPDFKVMTPVYIANHDALEDKLKANGTPVSSDHDHTNPLKHPAILDWLFTNHK